MHNQPLRNSDPAHTSFTLGELTKAVPAMTPLMLDATSGKLTVWNGQHVGAAYGVLAVSADQSSTELVFYRSGSFHIGDVLWPDTVMNEHARRNTFTDTAISIVWHLT